MVKVKIFVVRDCCNNIAYIGCNKDEAIKKAIEWDNLPSFEGWVDDWMCDKEGCDLLDLLDKKEPKRVLRDRYKEDIENNRYAGFKTYEVDVPLNAIDFGTELSPEVLAIIVNIFNC